MKHRSNVFDSSMEKCLCSPNVSTLFDFIGLDLLTSEYAQDSSSLLWSRLTSTMGIGSNDRLFSVLRKILSVLFFNTNP